MTLDQIEAIAAKYLNASVPETFAQQRLLIHEEEVKMLGSYRLYVSKPLKGVGGKHPRWPINIVATRPGGSEETLMSGKASAPWNVMDEIVAEGLKVMDALIEQQRGLVIQGRRAGMRVV